MQSNHATLSREEGGRTSTEFCDADEGDDGVRDKAEPFGSGEQEAKSEMTRFHKLGWSPTGTATVMCDNNLGSA